MPTEPRRPWTDHQEDPELLTQYCDSNYPDWREGNFTPRFDPALEEVDEQKAKAKAEEAWERTKEEKQERTRKEKSAKLTELEIKDLKEE